MTIIPIPAEFAGQGRTMAPPRRTVTGDTASTRTTPPDDLALSPLASLVASSGLDPTASWARAVGARLTFNLEFGAGALNRVTASGVYAAESQELDLTLRFDLPRPADGNGGTPATTLQVQLRLHASVNRSAVSERSEQKEDIVSLVRRVANAMLEVARSDDQRLAGVIFDADDLAELTALDGGRTLMTLMQLIQQIIDYSYRLKALHADGPGDRVEDVILTPQRRITQGVKTEYNETRRLDVALEIVEAEGPGVGDAGLGARQIP